MDSKIYYRGNNMEPQVKLELTIQQLNIIIAGLAKLPIEAGIETFNEVQKQAQSQLGQSSNVQGPLADKVVE